MPLKESLIYHCRQNISWVFDHRSSHISPIECAYVQQFSMNLGQNTMLHLTEVTKNNAQNPVEFSLFPQ